MDTNDFSKSTTKTKRTAKAGAKAKPGGGEAKPKRIAKADGDRGSERHKGTERMPFT